MNDIHVRQAFAYAWNAPAFTKSVLHSYASPAVAVEEPQDWTSVASPGQVSQYYSQIPTYPFSMTKARQELKESSVPNGFSASISYPQTDPDLARPCRHCRRTCRRSASSSPSMRCLSSSG